MGFESTAAFARNLDRALRETGLSQSEFARRLGVQHPTVWRWRQGLAQPELWRLPAIAKVVGWSAERLLGMPEGVVRVPMIERLSAGPVTEIVEGLERVALPAEWRADFAARVSGDSMLPLFEDGDTVAFRAARIELPALEAGEPGRVPPEALAAVHDRPVLFWVEGLREGGALKVARVDDASAEGWMLRLEPLNRRYRPYIVRPADRCVIHGYAVRVVREVERVKPCDK